jgi:hypothetical protein
MLENVQIINDNGVGKFAVTRSRFNVFVTVVSTTNGKQRIKTFNIQDHHCSIVLSCGAGPQKRQILETLLFRNNPTDDKL